MLNPDNINIYNEPVYLPSLPDRCFLIPQLSQSFVASVPTCFKHVAGIITCLLEENDKVKSKYFLCTAIQYGVQNKKRIRLRFTFYTVTLRLSKYNNFIHNMHQFGHEIWKVTSNFCCQMNEVK